MPKQKEQKKERNLLKDIGLVLTGSMAGQAGAMYGERKLRQKMLKMGDSFYKRTKIGRVLKKIGADAPIPSRVPRPPHRVGTPLSKPPKGRVLH